MQKNVATGEYKKMNIHTELLESLLRSLDWANENNSNPFNKLNLDQWESGYCNGYDTAISNAKSLILARLRENDKADD